MQLHDSPHSGAFRLHLYLLVISLLSSQLFQEAL